MNKNNQYTALAKYYDLLNDGTDYVETAVFIETIFEKYCVCPKIVLDMGCGTGNFSLEFNKRGYDMIGMDISSDMLSAATAKHGSNSILWICQDMTEFELYGSVDAVVSLYDSVNYITDNDKLRDCFKAVYNYLSNDGIFIFDINSKYKYENVYSNNDYIVEKKNVFFAWQNNYSKRNKICRFKLSIFDKKDDSYIRCDEYQIQKFYEPQYIEKLLKETGFDNISFYSDYNITQIADENNVERLYISASKIKNNAQGRSNNEKN